MDKTLNYSEINNMIKNCPNVADLQGLYVCKEHIIPCSKVIECGKLDCLLKKKLKGERV